MDAVLTTDQEEEILLHVTENADIGTTRIALAIGVDKSSACEIFDKEGLYQYYFIHVQKCKI